MWNISSLMHFMEILENFHKTWINQKNFPSEEFIKIIWHMNVSDELMFKKWGVLGWKWCTADCAQKFWNTFYFPCHKGWYERCKNCCCTECSLSCSEWRWLQDTMVGWADWTYWIFLFSSSAKKQCRKKKCRTANRQNSNIFINSLLTIFHWVILFSWSIHQDSERCDGSVSAVSTPRLRSASHQHLVLSLEDHHHQQQEHDSSVTS